MNTEDVLNIIRTEVERQAAIGNDGNDDLNSPNDWVAYITSYAGRAADTYRNDRENQGFRENLIKVAALCVSALKSCDKK